ncbi:hypothetical protein [Sedimentisphaera salicampi]|uniref:Uncharacterized protein n=1 Tax=Sedimentisphaera salicampi TaxID=1941349 RepID=A0A1W6LP88_9BACT|nr:hypothetical protein [Sedimentisphaera salicampi]ARN57608.1 hypothetical protein STSP1_02025 [Sedimentisphaera salicampi]
MNFLKRYLTIIIPSAIALAGLVVLVLTWLSNSALKEKMQDSVSMGSQVRRLSSQTPSAEQYKVEASYQKMHEEDAATIENMFLQTTMKELISYQIFPKPDDTSRQLFTDYSKQYRAAVEKMVEDAGGVDAPSEQEIKNVKAARERRSRTEEGEDPIVEALCRNKAASNPVYMNPRNFPWYDFWHKYEFVSENIAVQDCWNSQVALWVYKDVVKSVKTANADAQSVFASPVKRLLAVRFQKRADNVDYVSRGTGKSKIIDEPYYVTENNKPILVASSVTNRVGDNETLDVIHFSVSVVIEKSKIPEFVEELCSEKMHKFYGWDGNQQEKTYQGNQITILDWSSMPIIRDDRAHEYYRYGDKSVVQWTASCEYIFARKAYEEIIPESIKTKMQGEED